MTQLKGKKKKSYFAKQGKVKVVSIKTTEIKRTGENTTCWEESVIRG